MNSSLYSKFDYILYVTISLILTEIGSFLLPILLAPCFLQKRHIIMMVVDIISCAGEGRDRLLHPDPDLTSEGSESVITCSQLWPRNQWFHSMKLPLHCIDH